MNSANESPPARAQLISASAAAVISEDGSTKGLSCRASRTVGHLCYHAVPMPPIWVNEDGQRAETRPCPGPGCGREYPIRRYRYETLRQIGLPLFRVARFVGHAQELIPVPDDAEWVRLVPV